LVSRKESALKWTRIAAIVALVLVSAMGGYQVKAHAQQDFPPPCSVVVPAEWGKYRGNVIESGLVFEDKNGTLRIIQQLPCTLDGTPNGPPRVIAEIHRR
jgi:hypothetical protein